MRSVSQRFMLCRVKHEQELLAGKTQRLFSSPFCLPAEKLGPETKKGKNKSLKGQQVGKTKRKEHEI